MRQRIGSILVRAPQVAREYIMVDTDGSVLLGSTYVTVVKNTGSGDYSLTLKQPGAKFLHASITTIGTNGSNAQLYVAPDGTTIRVLTFNLATPTLTDTKFSIAIDIQMGARTNEY